MTDRTAPTIDARITRTHGLSRWPQRGSDWADLVTGHWATPAGVSVRLTYETQDAVWVVLDDQGRHSDLIRDAAKAWQTATDWAAEIGAELVSIAGVPVSASRR